MVCRQRMVPKMADKLVSQEKKILIEELKLCSIKFNHVFEKHHTEIFEDMFVLLTFMNILCLYMSLRGNWYDLRIPYMDRHGNAIENYGLKFHSNEGLY